MAGIDVRLRRIFKEDGKTVICPLDFGGFMGPVDGLYDPSSAVRKVVEGGCDAILVNPGMAATEWESYAGKAGLIVRVTGGSTKFSSESGFSYTGVLGRGGMPARCRRNLHHGAGGFKIMKQENVEIMGQVVSSSHAVGIPVLAEVIPCDPSHSFDPEWTSVCARVGYELGADAIKTYYTGEGFREIVEACRVPIVIAGGPKVEDPNTVVSESHGSRSSRSGVWAQRVSG